MQSSISTAYAASIAKCRRLRASEQQGCVQLADCMKVSTTAVANLVKRGSRHLPFHLNVRDSRIVCADSP
jgi:hypothetical protein